VPPTAILADLIGDWSWSAFRFFTRIDRRGDWLFAAESLCRRLEAALRERAGGKFPVVIHHTL
jgi:hypothetical protein